MAAAEIYDYVSTVSADNDITLQHSNPGGAYYVPRPRHVIVERGWKNQEAHTADDTSEEVVTLATANLFEVDLQFDKTAAAYAGTLFDCYFNAGIGNGIAESFKWVHPTDEHTYVVKFRKKMEREVKTCSRFGFPRVYFKVMGRIADA